MQIGMCTSLDNAQLVKRLGYDYIEPAANQLAAMSEADFETACANLTEAGLPAPAFNCLFPGEIRLLDGSCTDELLHNYLHLMLGRVQRMGGKVVVFGSGRSRMVPDGMPYDDAFRRLVEVTRIIGDVASAHDVLIVIEPLQRNECNIINSVAEGAALRAVVNHPNVALLSDYYHMVCDGEPISDVARVGSIAHAHIAAHVGRAYPMQEEGDDFRSFLCALKQGGYDARISVEGRTACMEQDGAAALAFLHGLWNEA